MTRSNGQFAKGLDSFDCALAGQIAAARRAALRQRNYSYACGVAMRHVPAAQADRVAVQLCPPAKAHRIFSTRQPVAEIKYERIQLAQSRPEELTGMNWLPPIYWSSTAEPWLPQREPVVAVVAVLGCALTLPE